MKMKEEENTNKAKLISKKGGNLIYEKEGYQLHIEASKKVSEMRVGVEIYLAAPENEESRPCFIRRSKILTGKNSLDFLLDLECCFTRDDLLQIYKDTRELLEKKEDIQYKLIRDKATVREIYQKVRDYIKSNQEDSNNLEATIYIRGKYGYFLTTRFPEFVEAYKKEFDCSRNEILDCLRIHHVLEIGKERYYDKQVSRGKKKLYFYKICMEENRGKEKEEMVV